MSKSNGGGKGGSGGGGGRGKGGAGSGGKGPGGYPSRVEDAKSGNRRTNNPPKPT